MAKERKFKKVPTFGGGEKVAEIMPLDSCRLLTPPIVFRDSRDFISWVESNVKGEELITLPYVISGAERWSKKDFISHVQETVISRTEAIGTEFQKPVVISEIDISQERKFAVLISEAINVHPEPITGSGQYYRFQDRISAQSIIKHGFYQIPGRFFGRDIPDDPIPDYVNLGLNLPNRNLMTDYPNPNRGYNDIALNPFTQVMGAKLTQELVASLDELILFNGNWDGNFLDFEILHKQVLAWGLVTGMLMKVDPSRIVIV